MMCKDGYQWCFSVLAKTGSIVFIHDSAAGKNIAQAIRIKSNWMMFPMDKVCACCMSPMHRTPDCAVRIVLIKQMISVVMKNQSIRIIHPFFFWREMYLWAVRFIEIGLDSRFFTVCITRKNQNQNEEILKIWHDELALVFNQVNDFTSPGNMM